MKLDKKILFFGIVAAVLFWFAGAFVDFLSSYYNDDTFLEVLLENPEEIRFRSFASVFILVFGIFIARMFSTQANTAKELQKSEAKYRALVESTEDSIYLVDREYRYLFINRKHHERMNLAESEYMGRKYRTFHSHDETKAFIEHVNEVFEKGVSVQHEHQSRRDNRFFLRTLSPVHGEDGTIIAVSVVSKDISQQKNLEGRLSEMLVTDELTGLYNRRGFFALAQQQLKLANRLQQGIYMLYADLDNMKEINDSFGHKEGDRALIDVAAIFKEIYRDSDIIARIGGDEFVVIPIEPPLKNVEFITERMEERLQRFNDENDRPYQLSLSYGIALYNPEFPLTIDDLIVKADKMMYEHKKTKPGS